MHSTPLTAPMPTTVLAPTLKGAAPGRERAQLEERGVGVDEQLDAFPGGELAAGVVALDVLGTPAFERIGEFGVDLVEPCGRGGGGGGVGVGLWVERGLQHGHDWYPRTLAASAVRISVVPPPMPRTRMSRYWRSTSDSAM